MAITKFRDENFFLSNFYPVEIKMDGVTYPTLEHAYQASKTLDKDERLMILYAKTPGKAKRISKELTVRKDWAIIKIEVMQKLLRQKFSKPELRKMLLATGDQEIIEGNEWGDMFWGISYRKDTSYGIGRNILGQLLMSIRKEARDEQAGLV